MTWILKLAARIVALATVLFVTANGAEATTWPYCRTDVSDYKLICSFTNMEECLATVSGRGGLCIRDPFLADARNSYAYEPIRPKAYLGIVRNRSVELNARRDHRGNQRRP